MRTASHSPETPTGQTRDAYQVAAGIMLFDGVVGIVFSDMRLGLLLAVIFRALVAIGLLKFNKTARTVALVISALALAAWLIVRVFARDDPGLAAFGSLGTLGYALAIALALTGETRSWRLTTAVTTYGICTALSVLLRLLA